VGDDIFIVEDLGNNRIRLIPAPTHVSEPGTPVNKALLQHMENHLVPPGAIIMWSGSINDIPVGWALCDGRNGTPDLRDRFIVGAGGSYNVGNTGGSNTVTLTTSQIPSHSHEAGTLKTASAGSHSHGAGTLKTDTTGSHSHSYRTAKGTLYAGGVMSDFLNTFVNEQTSTAGAHSHTISGNTASAGAHSHTISGNTASTGGGGAHENRPPYYALCFIMKL
jgi:microcystin-dependent protein